jgi:hypothetical protein
VVAVSGFERQIESILSDFLIWQLRTISSLESHKVTAIAPDEMKSPDKITQVARFVSFFILFNCYLYCQIKKRKTRTASIACQFMEKFAISQMMKALVVSTDCFREIQ